MWQLSLREMLGLVALVTLGFAHGFLHVRFRAAQRELGQLRAQFGYLPETAPDQVAAVRLPFEQPLTYRIRVRVPDGEPYRIAYSSVIPRGEAKPAWFAAVDVPPGESSVTVRIAKDPRDETWKIAAIVESDRGRKRFATTLPGDHSAIFRSNSEIFSGGVGRAPVVLPLPRSIRLLDERWLVGEGALLLYGDRPVERDQIGVFAELQSDRSPL